MVGGTFSRLTHRFTEHGASCISAARSLRQTNFELPFTRTAAVASIPR